MIKMRVWKRAHNYDPMIRQRHVRMGLGSAHFQLTFCCRIVWGEQPTMTREEAAEYLRQYIAAREAERDAYNARRRQAEEDNAEFIEAFEYDDDDNDPIGLISEDAKVEQEMRERWEMCHD